MPRVSVIMGIYNCQSTLEKAVDSIVRQTFGDWELIMCDDGSADGTYALANQFAEEYPEKIILLKNQRNMGLNHTLNICLQHAKGQYIARMDGDDVSLPHRFAVQVAYLDEHPEMAVVSAGLALFDAQGQWGQILYPEFPTAEDMMFRTPFAHASSIIRAEAMLAVGGYSEHKRLLRVEDYHLWYKIYKAGFRGTNLQEVLYLCQDDREAQGRRKLRYRLNESYVKWLVFRNLKPRWLTARWLLRPVLTGLMPPFLYRLLRKNSLGKQAQDGKA